MYKNWKHNQKTLIGWIKSIVSGIFKVQWSRLLLSQPVCAETKENETV